MEAAPAIYKTLLRAPDVFMSASDTARVLGVSARRLYRLVEEKALTPDGYVDGEMRFRWSQIERYVTEGRPRSLAHLPRRSQSLIQISVQGGVQE